MGRILSFIHLLRNHIYRFPVDTRAYGWIEHVSLLVFSRMQDMSWPHWWFSQVSCRHKRAIWLPIWGMGLRGGGWLPLPCCPTPPWTVLVLGLWNLTFTLAEPKTYVMVFCFFCFHQAIFRVLFVLTLTKKLFIFKLVMPLTCDPKRIGQLFVLLKKKFLKVWGSGEEREKAWERENNLLKLFIFSLLLLTKLTPN